MVGQNLAVSKQAHYDKQLASLDLKEKQLQLKKEALEKRLTDKEVLEKNKEIEAQLEQFLFEGPSSIQTAMIKMGKVHVGEVEESLEGLERALKGIVDKRVEIQGKIKNIEKRREAGAKSREQLQEIGGEPATIIDASTHSTLDGMYLSADKFRAKLKEAEGQSLL